VSKQQQGTEEKVKRIGKRKEGEDEKKAKQCKATWSGKISDFFGLSPPAFTLLHWLHWASLQFPLLLRFLFLLFSISWLERLF